MAASEWETVHRQILLFREAYKVTPCTYYRHSLSPVDRDMLYDMLYRQKCIRNGYQTIMLTG